MSVLVESRLYVHVASVLAQKIDIKYSHLDFAKMQGKYNIENWLRGFFKARSNKFLPKPGPSLPG